VDTAHPPRTPFAAVAAAPRPRDLVSLLLEPVLARGDEDRPALRWSGGWWSYGELAGAAGAAAGWLAGRGVRRGGIVAVTLPDSPEWVALFLGASRIGAAVAPLHPDIPPARRIAAAARLGADAVVTEEPDARAGRRGLAARELRHAIVTGTPDPGPAAVRPGDLAYLLLTSGSTGRPRWARHRADDIPACIATYGRRVLRLRPGDVTWSVAAMSTGDGLAGSVYLPLGAGAAAALPDRGRTPDDCARDCAHHGVTAVFGAPAFWASLARHVDRRRVAAAAFRRVRTGVSAGDPLPPAVWEAVERTLGLRLLDGLGSSEASSRYLSARRGGARPGTVGWPVPGYAVRLRPAGPGAIDGEGELLVRGPTIMEGYHGEGGPGPVDQRGWLATGDVVRREADGLYRFVRRRGERFKADGSWVDADRVAAVLRGADDVTDAIVIPVPDREGLPRVGAAVAARGGAAAALERLLAARAAEHLPPHEVPRAILVVGVLPTTPSGSVDRAEVLDRLTGRLADAAA